MKGRSSKAWMIVGGRSVNKYWTSTQVFTEQIQLVNNGMLVQEPVTATNIVRCARTLNRLVTRELFVRRALSV